MLPHSTIAAALPPPLSDELRNENASKPWTGASGEEEAAMLTVRGGASNAEAGGGVCGPNCTREGQGAGGGTRCPLLWDPSTKEISHTKFIRCHTSDLGGWYKVSDRWKTMVPASDCDKMVLEFTNVTRPLRKVPIITSIRGLEAVSQYRSPKTAAEQ